MLSKFLGRLLNKMSELNGKINCGDLTYHCKNKVIRKVLMILIMQWVLLKDKGW